MKQKIRVIKGFGLSYPGLEYEVVARDDDGYLYFYDQFDRWSSVEGSLEGELFEWVETPPGEDGETVNR